MRGKESIVKEGQKGSATTRLFHSYARSHLWQHLGHSTTCTIPCTSTDLSKAKAARWASRATHFVRNISLDIAPDAGESSW